MNEERWYKIEMKNILNKFNRIIQSEREKSIFLQES